MEKITVTAKKGIGDTGWTKTGAIKTFESQVREIDRFINSEPDREHKRLFRICAYTAKRTKKRVEDKLLIVSKPVPSLPAGDYTAGLFNISGWYRDLVLLLKDVKPLPMAEIVRRRLKDNPHISIDALRKEVWTYQDRNHMNRSNNGAIRTFKSKHEKKLKKTK